MGLLNAVAAGLGGAAASMADSYGKRNAAIEDERLMQARAKLELERAAQIERMREDTAIRSENRAIANARAPMDRAANFIRERVGVVSAPAQADPVTTVGNGGIHAEGENSSVNIGVGQNYDELIAKVKALPDGEEKDFFIAEINKSRAVEQEAASKHAEAAARQQAMAQAKDELALNDPQALAAYNDATKGEHKQLGPDGVLIDSSGRVIYANDAGQKRYEARSSKELEIAKLKIASSERNADAKIRADAAKIEQKFKMKQQDSPELTPEAIDAAAARYQIDGTLPSLGFGHRGATNRALVLNRAADRSRERGDSPAAQRVGQLATAANKSALQQLVKSEAMVGAFEENFRSNVEIAKEYIAKVDNSNMPLLNKGVQYLERRFTDDPNLGGLDIALKTVVNEYAKIVSGSMGNTATAEGEIKKITALLAAADTMGKLTEVLSVMERETENRMKGFEVQKERIISSMTGEPGREKKPTESPAEKTVAPTTATGKPKRPSIDEIFG